MDMNRILTFVVCFHNIPAISQYGCSIIYRAHNFSTYNSFADELQSIGGGNNNGHDTRHHAYVKYFVFICPIGRVLMLYEKHMIRRSKLVDDGTMIVSLTMIVFQLLESNYQNVGSKKFNVLAHQM